MPAKPQINVKRIYDTPAEPDGVRILVDRLWPRGLSKEKAHVDYWAKEIAPSTELRKWFGHDPARWDEFQRRYFAELDGRSEAVVELMHHAGSRPVTLLFGARSALNNAVALKRYLTERIS